MVVLYRVQQVTEEVPEGAQQVIKEVGRFWVILQRAHFVRAQML